MGLSDELPTRRPMGRFGICRIRLNPLPARIIETIRDIDVFGWQFIRQYWETVCNCLDMADDRMGLDYFRRRTLLPGVYDCRKGSPLPIRNNRVLQAQGHFTPRVEGVLRPNGRFGQPAGRRGRYSVAWADSGTAASRLGSDPFSLVLQP